MHQVALNGSYPPQGFIKYRRDLAQRYHCPVLSLIIQQFEFWFKKQQDKKAKLPKSSKIAANVFYKFISPPHKHHLYRQGDSWTEELCISADVFRFHFKKIGVMYKSYSLFKQAEEQGDIFQGKRYASYYNRLKRQVFFVKNINYDEVLDLGVKDSDKRDFLRISKPKRKLKRIISSVNQVKPQQAPAARSLSSQLSQEMPPISQSTEISINDLIVKETRSDISINSTDSDIATDLSASYLSKKTRVKRLINTVSRKPHLTGSNVHILHKRFHRKHSISFSFKEKESVDYLRYQKNKSTVADVTRKAVDVTNRATRVDTGDVADRRDIEDTGDKMIKIWQNRVGDTKLQYISAPLLAELQQVLKDYFEESLLHWDAYCQKIASSLFLMGEGKAWTFKGHIHLIWAMRAENIVKVQTNRISINDRELPLSADEINLKRQYSEIIQAIKEIKRQQERVAVEVNQTWRWAVQDQVDAILQGEGEDQEQNQSPNQDQDQSQKKLTYYQEQFENMIAAEKDQAHENDATGRYTSCLHYFNTSNMQQWRSMSRTFNRLENPWWYFERYLINILAKQHFGKDEQQLLQERQIEIEAQLQELSEQLSQLNLKRGLN